MKITVSYTIDENVKKQFDEYCDKGLHNKSRVINKLISDWLVKKNGESNNGKTTNVGNM